MYLFMLLESTASLTSLSFATDFHDDESFLKVVAEIYDFLIVS